MEKKSKISIRDVKVINLPSIQDKRGILTAIESTVDIPFKIKRIFYMYHISMDRGGHVHKETDQVVIAISGKFTVQVFDGKMSKCYYLDDPQIGLYIPRMIFINLFKFSKDSVCLVLANSHYDMLKSIRSKEEYLTEIE